MTPKATNNLLLTVITGNDLPRFDGLGVLVCESTESPGLAFGLQTVAPPPAEPTERDKTCL